ncbi:hypothetical protein ACP70R_042303 [Stipagrostis hirtigluma subsp. patula]
MLALRRKRQLLCAHLGGNIDARGQGIIADVAAYQGGGATHVADPYVTVAHD